MPDHTSNPPWRTITLLLLAAIFAFGASIIALLPPFEGIDETRHFSRLQSQAFIHQPIASTFQHDTKQAQLISKEVSDYYQQGPMPYMWIRWDKVHEEDLPRIYTNYHDFFKQGAQQDEAIAAYIKAYRESPLPKTYTPSTQPNTEYQHPPLYYSLLAPVMKLLAGHLSLAGSLFVLRLISYLMAFAGFGIGLWSTRSYMMKSGIADAGLITALGALYPFLMPEFFWEFARLGNDSLCLFFLGIIWALLLQHIRAPRGDSSLYLGFFLGLGWLTKALMIPVSGGVIAFLFLYHIRIVRKQSGHERDWWQAPLKTLGLLIFIGAPIYLLNYSSSGNVGSSEFTAILKTPEAWRRITQGLDADYIVNGIWVFLHSAVWIYGSWSGLVIALPVYKSLCVFTVIIMGVYIAAKCRAKDPLFSLPFWIIGPVLFGFAVHFLVVFAGQYGDSTPGYYLHILAPAFALIYGVVLKLCTKNTASKIIAVIFCVPIVALNFLIALSYMTVFSGCAVPQFLNNAYFVNPADAAACMTHLGSVISNLGILAWPHIALAGIAITFALLAVAGILSLSPTAERKKG